MDIPFGPWRPDVGAPGSGFARTAEGVVPKAETGGFGYGPFPQMVSVDGAEALSGAPRGIISVQAPDGTWSVYAATGTTIEELQSDFTWSDIETGRTVTAGDDVSFAMIGTKLLNTDTTDGMKAYDIVAGGANSAVSGAPAARATFVMKNVAFGLGTSLAPRRFASSDIGNYAKWAGGAANGGTLEDGGGLVGGADLKNGLGCMFQESAIRGIQFGAGASTYAVNKISDGLGCVAQKTIVPWDGRAYWWHDDGPWMLAAGSAPVSIGADKINTWAAENIGRQNFKHLQGAVDPQRKLILWRIDESRVLAYSWTQNEFSILPVSTTALARIATPAVSIDNLTGTIDNLTGSIDDLGGSSAPVLGGLNLSRKYSTFTGANMAVTLESCQVNNPVTGLVGWVTPVDDANAGAVQIGVSDRMDIPLTFKTGTAKTASGRCEARARGKSIGARRNIPAGTTFSYITGVKDIQTATGGRR